MPRALIVEDDESMASALKSGFELEGFAVSIAENGVAALQMLTNVPPDVVILDLMLPKLSGLDVCRKLRSEGNHVPLLVLTARDKEIDKVVGLKLGADDYMTKPFSFFELLARVEALLRRTASHPAAIESYEFGDVRVNFARGELSKAGKTLVMTPREMRLLQYFIANRGRIVAREHLLDAVWEFSGVPLTRTVDMHVAKLRRKIEDTPRHPRYIVTVHRLGYRFTG